MLRLKSKLNCIDNSGALICEVINVLKYPKNEKGARIGDECVVVVHKAKPLSDAKVASMAATATKIRRGDVRHAVVVRTKFPTQRPDGRTITFDDNACVLINNRKEPLASRVTGVVAAEVRAKGWGKIASIAPKIV